MLSYWHLLLIGLAGVAGGAVNALAGGGTLITFPLLTAVGIPPVAANVTNTVALCPGFLGGTFAQVKDLRGQERRLWLLLPASLVGGIAGAILLLNTRAQTFRALVPFLILFAAGLLAVQDRVRLWLTRRLASAKSTTLPDTWAIWPTALGAVYGGYFGAGLGVINLAALGLVLEDSLTRLNALKQLIALIVNVAAAILFLFSGRVVWLAALVLGVGALIGGTLGGRLAGRVQPAVLRRVVVTIGVAVGLLYLARWV